MQWEKNIRNVRGGQNDTRGGQCPPPLKYSLALAHIYLQPYLCVRVGK